MAYVPHTLIAFGGTFNPVVEGGGTEIWECSMRGTTGTDGTGVLADPDAYIEGIASLLSGWFSNPAAMIASYANLEYLKVNNIDAAGHYADAGLTHRHDYTTPVPGALPGAHPSILSVCYSWRTAVARGIGSHGRIFLPNATQGSANSMVISATAQSAYLVSATTLVQAIFPTTGFPLRLHPVVASRGSKASGFSNGKNTLITGVAVGQVIDVQRRRKNALAENYLTAGIS